MLDMTYMSLLHLGQPLMAAGYLGLIVTMVLSTAWRRPLMWLAPMGRMALTNYLMQSLILSLVFHGYALGQYRSEEHTSELQSLVRISYAVFCLKKKISKSDITQTMTLSSKKYYRRTST